MLIIAGALVTTTGSGLAVPDWPLSFGQFFPKMVGGVFFEHGHRMIAGIVGLLTAVLTVWIWITDSSRLLRRLSASALVAVVLQALLGGLTVLYQLPPVISILHAVLAQTFFCLIIAITYFTSSAWESRNSGIERKALEESPYASDSNMLRIFNLCALTTLFVYLQLIVGARLRHGGGQIFLMSHIAGALFVAFSIGSLFTVIHKWFKDCKQLKTLSTLLMSLLALQIVLGISMIVPFIANFLFNFSIIHTAVITIHVGTGAMILASVLLLTLTSLRYRLMLQTDRPADFAHPVHNSLGALKAYPL